MPVIESDFRSPWWMFNGHLQTVLPVLFPRKRCQSVNVIIPTRDGDQLSAYLVLKREQSVKNLLVLTHGLEGSNQHPYILGMTARTHKEGIIGEDCDVLAWNLRGCGAPDNITEKLYFAGSTQDLEDVIIWANARGYNTVNLAGYSLGGSVTLKWLGDKGVAAKEFGVNATCVASAPTNLSVCVNTMDQWCNFIYRLFFIVKMKRKIKHKAALFPRKIDTSLHQKVNSFRSYDEIYSAPLNGYVNADDLHKQASAESVLTQIAIPSLLVMAKNDPFYKEAFIPRQVAEQQPYLTLEITETGGHVGFLSHRYEWWLEQRFLSFFKNFQ